MYFYFPVPIYNLQLLQIYSYECEFTDGYAISLSTVRIMYNSNANCNNILIINWHLLYLTVHYTIVNYKTLNLHFEVSILGNFHVSL